jgi:F-type H+-transporting ATPase subunit epsilon
MADPLARPAEKRLHVTVVTADRPVFQGEAEFVVVPGPDDGEVGFLPGHAPYMAMLGYGPMRINEPGGRTLRFAVYGGFVQVLHDRVVVLANRAQKAGEITPEHVEADRREIAALRAVDDESYRKKMLRRRETQARARAARAAARL